MTFSANPNYVDANVSEIAQSNTDGTFSIKSFTPGGGYGVGVNNYRYETGDFNQEDIDDLVEAYARDEVRNPKDFLEEHGLSVANYLDKGSLIRGIIESDGRGGFLNYYDSEEYEERVCDEWIFIYRVD